MRRLLFLLLLTGCSSQLPNNPVGDNALNVATAALDSGNPALALGISAKVLDRNPKDVDAQVKEAEALYSLGRTDESCALFEQLYRTRAEPPVTLGLARCLIRTNPARAASLLKEAALKMPGSSGVLTDLGIAEDLTGQHGAAQADYQRALRLNPLDIPAQVDFALSLAVSGQSARAAEILRPLAEGNDSDRRIRQDYGAALSLSGRVNEGAAILAADLPGQQARLAALTYRTLNPVKP